MVTGKFKNSEIGKIPDDWDCSCIIAPDIATLISGLTYKPENVKKFGTLVLRSSNIRNWKLSYTDNVYVNCSIPEHLYVCPNDILVCVRNGSRNLIGKAALIPRKLNITFGAFMSVLRSNMGEYLFQVFCSDIIQRQIAINCSATINQITRQDFKKIYIPLPTSTERQHIAEALSDIDHLIASTEKLIAKKKAIKQGMMQELLTGKRRLPGFTKPWELKKLSQCGYLQKELIYPEKTPQKQFCEYSMPAYDIGKKPLWVNGKTINSARIKISDSVLLFNKLNVRQKRVWNVCNCPRNSVCSSEFLPFYSDSINLTLLEGILLSDKVTQDFENASSGTSNSQKRITPNQFLDYVIFIPQEKEEQDIIATFLDSLNWEINSIYQKLDKLLKLKQGMMSELLTGRIRLIGAQTTAENEESSQSISVPKQDHNEQFDDAVQMAINRHGKI